jgi:hypothetical protein
MEEPYTHRLKRQLSPKTFLNSHGGNFFASNVEMFNNDDYPGREQARRAPASPQEVFKYTSPNKKGWMGTLDKFPEYMGETREQPPLKRTQSGGAQWKPRCPNRLSRPTPSVVGQYLNVLRLMK